MWTVILLSLFSSLAINILLFLIAFRLQSDKLTDISYALSFLAIAIVGLIHAPTHESFVWIVFLMVAAWAIRIGGFLLTRILKVGKDKRFDGMRESFTRFGKFWIGQALTAWVVMLPTSMAMYHGGSTGLGLLIGIAIWLVGLLIESFADYRKLQFKLDTRNADKWIQVGLWKYSRHPNFFGEIMVWCGIYVACFSALSGAERLVGLASPLLITLLLRYVSGVPLLEKSADKRWGKLPDYQNYKRHTRLLLPLPK